MSGRARSAGVYRPLTDRQAEVLLAAGARAYLTKPLQIGQFLDAVDAALSRPKHSPPQQSRPHPGIRDRDWRH